MASYGRQSSRGEHRQVTTASRTAEAGDKLIIHLPEFADLGLGGGLGAQLTADWPGGDNVSGRLPGRATGAPLMGLPRAAADVLLRWRIVAALAATMVVHTHVETVADEPSVHVVGDYAPHLAAVVGHPWRVAELRSPQKSIDFQVGKLQICPANI